MDPTSTNIVNNEIGVLIHQLGFGGLIFTAFMFLLKWVLKTQEKILDNAREERVSAQKVNEGYLKTIEQINIQSGEFHKQVTEAHNYQRTEHEKILEGLNKACLMNQQYGDCLEKIKDSLVEQGRVMARINGYKKE